MKLSNLETVFNALNQANIHYLVAGGIAVNIHGYQRMTADLDLVIQLNSSNIINAMNCLNELGYQPLVPVTATDFADPEKRKNWIETKHMQVLSLQSQQYPETTIDIFVTEPFNFDDAYKSATIADLAPNINFRLVNIPTLIKMKQEAGRAKDLDDIEHLQMILREENSE